MNNLCDAHVNVQLHLSQNLQVNDNVPEFLDVFFKKLWIQRILLDSRFKIIFFKVSLLWSFTPSCHSWHLTNRWRKSEKVMALFLLFSNIYIYISIFFLLYDTLTFFFFVLDFSWFFPALPFPLLHLYLCTCTLRLVGESWSVTSHQWVSSLSA